jgi:hypothetical protein
LVTMRDPQLEDCVFGYTDQGWSSVWNAGSFFFTAGARDIFLKIYDTMLDRNCNEQDALTYMLEVGLSGCKKLNMTYNVGIYHLWQVLKMIDKPLLVVHFHPHKPRHLELFVDLIPQRLKEIFKNYGIERK